MCKPSIQLYLLIFPNIVLAPIRKSGGDHVFGLVCVCVCVCVCMCVCVCLSVGGDLTAHRPMGTRVCVCEIALRGWCVCEKGIQNTRRFC